VASIAENVDTTRSWPRALGGYARPRLDRSLLDLGTSVVPYLALLAAMVLASRVSTLLTIALAVPAAGFLLRTFIVFHDCAHGSFFRSRRANNLLGAATGLLVWLPFRSWQHEHAVHHATSGNLDRRGVGDILTLTVAEYRALPVWGRVGYRLFRNPVVMFGLGWLLVLLIKPRFVPAGARPRVRNSILGTNVALAAVVAAACLTLGWRELLLVQGPVLLVAGTVGVWLFYVQHQFEDTYWANQPAWRYEHAALAGSSYLKLPRLLQFFTGNIGFHHVHHLSAAIPNYNLQQAHEETPALRAVPELTLRDGLRATRLKLWDEESNRLVGFRDARR
jgi:omega-6 fatty acid desaturase (delta-12 desaturase)